MHCFTALILLSEQPDILIFFIQLQLRNVSDDCGMCSYRDIAFKAFKKQEIKRFLEGSCIVWGGIFLYAFYHVKNCFLCSGSDTAFCSDRHGGRKEKEMLGNIGRSFGIMVIAVVVCLPVTFTVQRTVPALVSEPYVYEIESYVDEALRGRKLDSVEFMRVGRFIDVFAEKIFSIPEGTFDIYGEIAEYERISNEQDRLAAELSLEEWKEDENPAETDYEEADLADAVSTEENSLNDDPQKEDYTNGRIDIFRSYIEQLNMTGHEEMGAVLKDGAIATHAHNIYLQAAYDHGIPVGILFMLTGIGTFAASLLYYHKKKDKITYAALPAMVTVAVAVAGMVEWIFHLCNPCGFVLMLAITPLIFNRNIIHGN